MAREREGERSMGPEEEVEEEEGALRFWFLVSCIPLPLPLPLALLLLLVVFLPWVVVIFFVFFALPATALPPLVFLALGMLAAISS